MSKSNNLGDFLTGIADAIRAKTGSSALIDPQDFDTEIANLPSGGGKFASLVDRSITEVTADDLDGVTSIGERSFFGCPLLASVTIPNSVMSIGNFSFQDCTSLIGITIPDSVTSIGNQAFYNCASLTNITIPNSVTSIGTYTFKGCTSLDSVTINATTPPTLSNSNAFNDTNNCPIYVPANSVSAYQAASGWSSLSSRIQAIPFNNYSWSDIRTIARSGNASSYFSVGDTKTVTLTNNTTMTVRIADMTTGRYDFADNSGNKSNMVIEFVECFADTASMNSTATNSGGWASCEMRSTTMPACLALLPQDMQNAMSEVLVLSGVGNSTTSGTSSSNNKLFLPCEWEIFGAKTYSIGSSEAGSSGQFGYYALHNTASYRIKYRAGSAAIWWLRSPCSGSTIFCTVSSSGGANGSGASYQNGVSPVFAI